MSNNSVKPLIDGEEVFEDIAKLIKEAQRWCNLVVWGFDEDVRFSRDGQNDTATPIAEQLLKQKAVTMLRAGIIPDTKILIWNGLLDDDYSKTDGSNDVGDLGVVTVLWKDVKCLRDQPFLDYMRRQLSAADDQLLLKLLSSYREIQELQDDDSVKVSFPSGIHVAMQKHPIDTNELVPSFFDGLTKSLKRIFLNPDTVPSVTLRLDEVLTVSDIMAYTFISARETGQKPNNPDASGSPQERFRCFLEKSNMYLHSKCSIFLNRRQGGRHWTTVGSANISPHSLDYNGEQDSEMNVWWQHQEGIEKFILDLWREHLNDKGLWNADAALRAEKGWKNPSVSMPCTSN